MVYILVGFGGLLGSITRFLLGRFISEKFVSAFPRATFIINITGALLLGVISSIDVTKNLYFLFADGFLGAYTTFSTFIYEGYNLLNNKRILNASIYIVASLLIGVLGFFAGSALGSFILAVKI